MIKYMTVRLDEEIKRQQKLVGAARTPRQAASAQTGAGARLRQRPGACSSSRAGATPRNRRAAGELASCRISGSAKNAECERNSRRAEL